MGSSLPSKPAFRSTLQRFSMASKPNAGDEAPQEEAVNYLKYQDYIEKNEELFQKVKSHHDMYEIPEGVGFLMWDWEVANE